MKIILFQLFIITIFCQNLYSQENIETIDLIEIEESGNYKEALIIAKNNLELDSLNEKNWIAIAKLYRLNQQYKNTILAYEKALKINPENHKLILALAKTNWLIGKKEGSIKLYKDFLKYEPNNIMALNNLAQIYSSGNQPDSAAILYKKLHFQDTTNVEYLYKYANNLWFSGDLILAFNLYNKAYKLDPYYLPVVFDLSRIYINKNRQGSAMSILELNIKNTPNESRLYADLGNAYFSNGDYSMAKINYEKAIKLGFNGKDAYKRLAISYYSTKEFEKSRVLFESLNEKDSTDYKICMYLGNIYIQLNDAAKGLSFFYKSIDLLTPDPMVITAIYSGIADSYNAQGKYIEQIDAIKNRQDNTPEQYKSPIYLQEIAEIYEINIKNDQKALEFYHEYYNVIKDLSWFNKQDMNNILDKISTLKEKVFLEK